MARRSDRPPGETQQHIRAAAFQLFGRFGYDGVSINAVADRVQLTKAAIYWHYTGKDELFMDCLSDLHALVAQTVFSNVAAYPTSQQQLMAMFQGICLLLDDHRIRAGVAGYWLQPSSVDLVVAEQARRRFEQDNSVLMADLFQRCVDDKVLNERIEVADMASAVTTIVQGLLLPLQDADVREQLRQTATLVYTFLSAYENGDALANKARLLVRDEITVQQLTDV